MHKDYLKDGFQRAHPIVMFEQVKKKERRQ